MLLFDQPRESSRCRFVIVGKRDGSINALLCGSHDIDGALVPGRMIAITYTEQGCI